MKKYILTSILTLLLIVFLYYPKYKTVNDYISKYYLSDTSLQDFKVAELNFSKTEVNYTKLSEVNDLFVDINLVGIITNIDRKEKGYLLHSDKISMYVSDKLPIYSETFKDKSQEHQLEYVSEILFRLKQDNSETDFSILETIPKSYELHLEKFTVKKFSILKLLLSSQKEIGLNDYLLFDKSATQNDFYESIHYSESNELKMIIELQKKNSSQGYIRLWNDNNNESLWIYISLKNKNDDLFFKIASSFKI